MTDFSSYSPEFATALVKAQGAIEGAKKGKTNPAFRSKYADLGACWEACREALQDNSLGVFQFTATASREGHAALLTRIVYGKTGEFMDSKSEIPLKDPTNPQAYGSAVTYARRYALCALMGICPEDDDGNAASASPKPPSQPAARDLSVMTDRYSAEFNKLTNRDEMKVMYSRLKNSDLADSHKTTMLSTWAEKIKETK